MARRIGPRSPRPVQTSTKLLGRKRKPTAPPAAEPKSKGRKLDKEQESPRRSTRKTTAEKTEAAELRATERAKQPPRGHAGAKSRATDPIEGKPTAPINQAKVERLQQNKEYKKDTFRVHNKGSRLPNGSTTGNPLSGAHIDRSSWTPEQKKLNQELGDHLKTAHVGFQAAPHKGGEHGAEISHVRRQAAGGMTDRLGAQPASVHYNIEDMAREEAQQKLADNYGDRVRMKSTAYVHNKGEFAGSVKARRHKIQFKNAKGEWETKFDHLQDGHRNNIDKNEVAALKKKMESLSPTSPNADLHPEIDRSTKQQKGILSGSDVSAQKNFVPKRNDTTVSPYFTDLQTSDGVKHTGQAADAQMAGLLSQHTPSK